jgi:predicted RNase H-like HicB family nuclease
MPTRSIFALPWHIALPRGGWRLPMRHYIAICIQQDTGDWRAVFPEVPGCEARGCTLDDIKRAAQGELMRHLSGEGLLDARSLTRAVPRIDDWMAENQLDMSKAIVTVIAGP